MEIINVYKADSDFVEIMGLRMAQGRALTDDPADAQAVVINETAARILGLAEPLGKTISASKERLARRGRDRGLSLPRSAP